MNEPNFTNTPPTQQAIELHSPIMATVARLAVPLTMYVALIIFFQGHNKPGGGFIAGVLAAAAGCISLIAFGTQERATFPRWLVFVLAAIIFPASGYSAVVITIVVGVVFHFVVRNVTLAQFPWWRMACLGLLISISTGIVPMLGGYAFMDHAVWDFHLPLLGHDHLPTATFFDLGVFLIVIGTLMTIFVELGLEGQE